MFRITVKGFCRIAFFGVRKRRGSDGDAESAVLVYVLSEKFRRVTVHRIKTVEIHGPAPQAHGRISHDVPYNIQVPAYASRAFVCS